MIDRVLWLACLPAIAANVNASELSDSYALLCQKIKECSAAEISSLPAEQRAMMEPMLESMCQQMQQNFAYAQVYPDLHTSAAACIRSMAALPCDEFNQASTAECRAFEEKARSYGQPEG